MHLAPDRTDILAVLLPYRHDYLSQHIHGYQRIGCRCKSPGPAMGAGRGERGSYHARQGCTKLSGGTTPRVSPHFRGPRDGFPRAKTPREKGVVTMLVLSAKTGRGHVL
jgi:hypothetical protein